jgi:hypothetical protein
MHACIHGYIDTCIRHLLFELLEAQQFFFRILILRIKFKHFVEIFARLHMIPKLVFETHMKLQRPFQDSFQNFRGHVYNSETS